ncbi:MAG: type II toxin-antitoxin system VapC family toxin, partial [Thermoleophilaceae bacterium]
MTIVDASAIVDLLAPPDPARRDFLVRQLPEPAAPWLAPDILLFEVFAVIRRHVLRAVISEANGGHALRRLLRLPIELVPSASLLS